MLSWVEENKKRKRRFFRKEKTLFLSDFFCGENFVKEKILTQDLIFTTFGKQEKRRIEICFVLLNNQKKRSQRRGFNNREHKQRVSFYTTKRRYCVPIFQRCLFSTLWKMDIGKMTLRDSFQKRCFKKRK